MGYRRSLAAFALCLAASRAGAQYVPPMGIPAPPFGINEIAGATTVTKTQADTVSGTLAAGTVMSVSGTHNNVSINASNCTVGAPCFILGGVYTGTLTISGGSHYLIFQGITAYNPDISGDHVAIRQSNIVGDLAGGGIFATASYVVVYANLIHDIGDLDAAMDIDRHCIPVGNNSHHYWILGNIFYHCGGDAVQVNGTLGNQAGVHHVYIGANIATDNRQTAFWAKQSTDVVISQNFAYHFRRSSGGQGDCIGSQYGARRLVLLNNRLWDCMNGINLRSSDAGVQSGAMIVGNVIADVIHTAGESEATVNSQADGACMILSTSGASPSKHLVYFNTCTRSHGGVQLPGGAVSTFIGYNIFDHASIAAIVREGVTATTIDTNVFYPIASLVNVTGANHIVGDPKFLGLNDFRLDPTSPAHAQGTDILNTIYAALDGSTYLTNHGISLPNLGATPDLGAFTDLFLCGCGVGAPSDVLMASSRKRGRRGGL